MSSERVRTQLARLEYALLITAAVILAVCVVGGIWVSTVPANADLSFERTTAFMFIGTAALLSGGFLAIETVIHALRRKL